MKRFLFLLVSCLFLSLSILTFPVYPALAAGGWSDNPSENTPLSELPDNQNYAKVIRDADSNYFAGWIDWLDGNPSNHAVKVFLQKLDADGHILWQKNGIPVTPAFIFSLNDFELESDGLGGVYVSWNCAYLDSNGNDNVLDQGEYLQRDELFVQRIDANGIKQWANPVRINSINFDMEDHSAVPDGHNGLIIHWISDYPLVHGSRDPNVVSVCAQRIDSNGSLLWGNNGVLVFEPWSFDLDYSYGSVSGFWALTVPDGNGGAFLGFDLYRSNGEASMEVIRIDSDGQRMDGQGQTIEGTVLGLNGSVSPGDVVAIASGDGGAIFAWQDNYGKSSGYPVDIYAQKVDSNGTILWGNGGVPVCAADGDQGKIVGATPRGLDITTDGAGGTILTWEDRRSGLVPYNQVFVQRVDNLGNALWAADGIGITPVRSGTETEPRIVSDGNGGAVVSWVNYSGLVSQRIDENGNRLWQQDRYITNKYSMYKYHETVSDGNGGMVAVWQDYYPDQAINTYIQNIKADGTLGEEAPSEYSLTILVEGPGTTAPGEGTHVYNPGEVVNLAAMPGEGYWFTGWAGDTEDIVDPKNPETTITMNDDYTITARFVEIVDFNLTIAVSGNGTVTPAPGVHTCRGGTSVDLTAVQADGWRFTGWTGDTESIINSNSSSTSILMDNTYSITAVFDQGMGTGPVHNIDTGENFASIQAAIDDANTLDGHTILVDDGNYIENVNVTKELIIESTNSTPMSTVVTPLTDTDHVFEILVDNVIVRGFLIYGTSVTSEKAGIELHEVNDCIIENNICGLFDNNDYGILLFRGGGHIIRNNFCDDNDFGIRIMGSCYNLIENNTLEYNELYDIYLDYSPYPLGSNFNTIRGNNCTQGGSEGIYIKSSSNNIIENNIIDTKVSANGIELYNSSDNVIRSNDISVMWGAGYSTAIKLSSTSFPSQNNIIYLNHLHDNDVNTSVVGGTGNQWYSNEKLEYVYNGNTYRSYLGNYYDDYGGTDSNGDGIGETPYEITTDNPDVYPLTSTPDNYDEVVTYILTVYSLPGGSVTVPGEGSFPYNEGDIARLTAVPAEGYRFLFWSGDTGTIADINAPDTTIQMSSNYYVSAVFSPLPQYSLTVNVQGSGTTTPPEGEYFYFEGTTVNLSAVAAEGWQFSNWEGEVADSDSANTTVLMDKHKAITAVFNQLIQNNPPDKPVNELPENGTVNQMPMFTLEASDFYDIDDDTHIASQWQIVRNTGESIVVLYDSGETEYFLTSIMILGNTLNEGITCSWCVRYKDSRGAWSEWSDYTTFTTYSSPAQPGDANGDGTIDAFDITKIVRIILELDPPTPGADADGNEIINVLDISKTARIILGIDY
ncbi:MAG: right-handed parallel beta-helix repeat-containing protein [Dehalococcoidales bacterium]|nr:right-handed parallel beta-helix repeat-containing protein [Dehalococcoidales bacterium]